MTVGGHFVSHIGRKYENAYEQLFLQKLIKHLLHQVSNKRIYSYPTMDFYLVEKPINYFVLGLMGSYHKKSYKIFIFQFIFKALISS